MSENMELAEISAAKDAVMVILEDVFDEDNDRSIEVADAILEDLMRKGIRIPHWFPMLDGKPAQGRYPTTSEVEAWRGIPVTPVHVTPPRKSLATDEKGDGK